MWRRATTRYRRPGCAAITIYLFVGIPAGAEQPFANSREPNSDVRSSQFRRDVERLRFHLERLERTAQLKPSGQTQPAAAVVIGGAAAPMPALPWVPLPAFAGSAHLYHVGAEDFFLDHAEALDLSADQHGRLRLIKERSALDQSEVQRKIATAEEQLWLLTAADRPDTTKVEAKVREIEKLRADRRLAFIHAVGEAALLLTDAQRATLVGPPKAAASPATPDGGVPPAGQSKGASGEMGPM